MNRDQVNGGPLPPGPIRAPNPFLEALGPPIPYLDISHRMAFSPLKNIELAQIPLAHREDFLALIKQHFLPTTDAQKIAAAMQTLLRDHYSQRNPHYPSVRRILYTIASHSGGELAGMPWFSNGASGLIIEGITGLGKSTIVDRYLSLIPQQVVEYGIGEVAGYVAAKQIVWLKVDMSVDGSRAGFLLSILAGVDQLVGSDYHEQYSRSRLTVEKLMVRVGLVLSTHFCGMLIVEEIQAGNFSDSKWAKELATFFLRLLNFGIPVVLVGNPLGFAKLSEHSQLMRRLTLGGKFWMHPYESSEDFDWQNILVPGVFRFNVMPMKTELDPEMRAAFYKYSGGINGFLARLWVDSQRIAIHRGATSVSLTHLHEAYKSETIAPNHNLIQGFATKNVQLLSGYKDIPTNYYSQIWRSNRCNRMEDANTESTKAEGENNCGVRDDIPEKRAAWISAESKFKAEKTKAKNRVASVKSLNISLSSEDMRRDGAQASLIRQFEELKKSKE